MWAVAYGLVSIALLAFVILYAVLHMPYFSSIGLADQLYSLKLSLNRTQITENYDEFNKSINVTLVKGNVPIGYKLRGVSKHLTYDIYLYVNRCTHVLSPSGEPAVMYEITLRHSLDILPWVETYAYIPSGIGVMERVEYAMVYNDVVRNTVLYIRAPIEAALVYVVDYPLALPLGCPEVSTERSP